MVSDAPLVVGILVCFHKGVDRACDALVVAVAVVIFAVAVVIFTVAVVIFVVAVVIAWVVVAATTVVFFVVTLRPLRALLKAGWSGCNCLYKAY